jgi:ABC-2 type transport system permease protein
MEHGMRREGSPWRGVGAVFLKELSDHLTGARMFVLEWLIVLTAAAAVYVSIQQIKNTSAEDPFLFLRLFTQAGEQVPLSFATLLSFLVPLVAIGLGFDLVNSEHSRRTLSRILSQPIYRDALLFGKFLGALAAIGISLVALWLLLIGLGLFTLGLPPSGEEIARALVMLVVTIFYAGVWLALAMLLSTVFRSPATAALSALGLWLFLTILWPIFSPWMAGIFATREITSAEDLLGALSVRQAFARVSPSALFGEIVSVVLDPSVRSTQQPMLAALGLALIERGSIPGAPLPFLQSILIVWGQIVGLIAATILLFVADYVVFQRQEVRA